MDKFELNGVEVEYDAFDADTAGAMEAMRKDITKAGETVKNLKGDTSKMTVATLCQAVKKGLDGVFGEGMGEKICGKKHNMLICADVYGALLLEDERQAETIKENPNVQHLLGLVEKAKE